MIRDNSKQGWYAQQIHWYEKNQRMAWPIELLSKNATCIYWIGNSIIFATIKFASSIGSMSKPNYIDLVYNWKSEYASIPDLQLRKQQVAAKLGIEIPIGQTHEKEVIEYLNKQAHYRYTLLISRMQLLEDMLGSLKSKPKAAGEDADLKYVKLQGDIDALCGRLVDDIEAGFKTIYAELAETAKEQVKKVRSVEQRLKEKEWLLKNLKLNILNILIWKEMSYGIKWQRRCLFTNKERKS